MFALKMFYKLLISTSFHTHHLKKNLKYFLSNVLTTFYHKRFVPTYLECLLNIYLQTVANTSVGEK